MGKAGATKFFESCINATIAVERERCAKTNVSFKDRTHADHHTSDFIRTVFSIKNEGDAKKFYRGYVEWLKDRHKTGDPAPEVVAKANVCWVFGEGMERSLIQMWIKACGAAHPVFGTKIPTPEE